MAPLHGAIAFEEVHQIAVRVGEDLHFDVTARVIAFSRYTSSLPNAVCASLRAVVSNSSSSSARGTARVPRPPPPQLAFTINGKPISAASLRTVAKSRGSGPVAGATGTPACTARFRAATLLPSVSITSGGRTHPDQTRVEHRTCELRVLREKSVTRMHCVAARLIGDAQQIVDVEVRLHRCFALPDQVCLVRFETMQREAIFLREHRDGADAEFDSRALYADGNLATVGDENALDAPRLNHQNARQIE